MPEEKWYSKLMKNIIKILMIGALITFAFIIVYYILIYAYNTDKTPSARAIMFLLGGGVIFIITLILGSVVLSVFKETNRKHALGLPEGSVRALISVLLIIIFVSLSLSLFGSLERGTRYTSSGLSLVEKDKMIANLTYGRVVAIQSYNDEVGETYYNLSIEIDKNQDSVDFAKQLLTTISTLIVAVVGFYFGVKSTELKTWMDQDKTDFKKVGDKLEKIKEYKEKGILSSEQYDEIIKDVIGKI